MDRPPEEDILQISKTTRSVRGRPLVIALVAASALVLPLPATAQDAEQSPAAEETMAASEVAQVDEAGIPFPVMLGGQLLSA